MRPRQGRRWDAGRVRPSRPGSRCSTPRGRSAAPRRRPSPGSWDTAAATRRWTCGPDPRWPGARRPAPGRAPRTGTPRSG
ncbi:MAG: hypothetical protein E6F99_30500 [Actinobacteria bacterium]|nr:MAG: hypothetical protein E6F99_30500 [Actinomycetota bacterium]